MAKLLYDRKKPTPTHKTSDEYLMTNYDLEYTQKLEPRTKPYVPPELLTEVASMLPDPISKAFGQNLLSDFEIERVPGNETIENGTEFYQKLKERKPSIQKVVDQPVDQRVLKENHELYNGRTMYQVDYCKINDYTPLGQGVLRPKPVPDEWKPVPSAVQRLDYRNHTKLAPWKITPEPARIPPSYFDPKPEEREILNVKTGPSKYEAVIGRLGTEIIKREYHGHVNLLPGEYVAKVDRKGEN
ncbi:Hypothetical protein NTJ_14823 [Nesidiocoris tenuis]|uniref:Uncharacterized protein n=1 Tax=Nesidiocoris tenuis TaxID=355587 RepID=A0ABN7BDS4_9HEMI|nr:Hypothetical protein NTJ_14823 [Nesidiocoris tenuis]